MDAAKAAYRAMTRQIEVIATPRFLPERSSPENGYFFWAYTITLTNRGAETVQLKTRHWRITDALSNSTSTFQPSRSTPRSASERSIDALPRGRPPAFSRARPHADGVRSATSSGSNT